MLRSYENRCACAQGGLPRWGTPVRGEESRGRPSSRGARDEDTWQGAPPWLRGESIVSSPTHTFRVQARGPSSTAVPAAIRLSHTCVCQPAESFSRKTPSFQVFLVAFLLQVTNARGCVRSRDVLYCVTRYRDTGSLSLG